MADNPPKLGELVPEGETRRDAIHIAVAPLVAGMLLKPGQPVYIIDRSTEGKLLAWSVFNMDSAIGIVDPFLTEDVQKGQVFWLCLKPNSITSLKHVWTHPSFVASPLKENVKTVSKDFKTCSDKQALEAQLVLDPYDAITRKAYADWLEENGYIEDSVIQREWTYEKQTAEDELREFATKLEVSFAKLIRVMDNISNNNANPYDRDDTYIHCNGFDTPDYLPEEIWKYYENYKGKEVQDKTVRFVSCSC